MVGGAAGLFRAPWLRWVGRGGGGTASPRRRTRGTPPGGVSRDPVSGGLRRTPTTRSRRTAAAGGWWGPESRGRVPVVRRLRAVGRECGSRGRVPVVRGLWVPAGGIGGWASVNRSGAVVR
ncbi:hypothetical protein GCM10010240_50570 [Streptomyces griseoviridis]|nr:hypothetical protein GCM10010240_50570 [Streptomyces griseoviridis]